MYNLKTATLNYLLNDYRNISYTYARKLEDYLKVSNTFDGEFEKIVMRDLTELSDKSGKIDKVVCMQVLNLNIDMFYLEITGDIYTSDYMK